MNTQIENGESCSTLVPGSPIQLVDLLRQEAKVIANEGIPGWGNVMTAAADEIERLRERVCELQTLIDCELEHQADEANDR